MSCLSAIDSRGADLDQNLRGAFLHVLAHAMTCVPAIAALLANQTVGWVEMDHSCSGGG